MKEDSNRISLVCKLVAQFVVPTRVEYTNMLKHVSMFLQH